MVLKQLKIGAVAAAMLLLGIGTSLAEKQTKRGVDTLGYVIDEVVFSQGKLRFDVVSTTPSQILSGKELERLNWLSVADAARYFSGIQLVDYGGIGGIKTINVRSMGSAHTAIFYDGVRINSTQNGQVDLGRYSLDNIESIELYSGQKSTIFQPAIAFLYSSSMYMEAKSPKFTKTKPYNIKASVKTGSFGLINPSVVYQQKIVDQLSISTNVEWKRANGRYKFRYRKDNGYDTTAMRQNGDVESLRAEMIVRAKAGKDGEAMLKVYFYDSEQGLPGAIVANRYEHTQRQWDWSFFLHGSLHKSFAKGHDLLANIKYGREHTRYLDPEYITQSGALDNRYYQNELYASLVNQYSIFSWWDISLSTDFVHNTLDANLYRFPRPTRNTYVGALSTKMEWKRLNLQASLMAIYIDERVKQYQRGDSRSVFAPTVSLSIQPFKSKGFRLRAMYKEALRMPTFNDLYYTFVGNSSLRPEFTTQYNLGVTWAHTSPSALYDYGMQVDIFYNHIRDKIVAMPSSNLFRWTMTNLGEVSILGAEMNIHFAATLPHNIKLGVNGNYTYQHSKDITPASTTHGDQIPYTPRHSSTAIASFGWREFELNYSFIYTGERYSQKANIPANYVKPWYTHTLAVAWSGTLRRELYMRVGLEVNNLFDHHYDVVLNFPMPGRHYKITLAFNF